MHVHFDSIIVEATKQQNKDAYRFAVLTVLCFSLLCKKCKGTGPKGLCQIQQTADAENFGPFEYCCDLTPSKDQSYE